MPSFITKHPYLSAVGLGGPAIAGGAYLGSQLQNSPFLFGKKARTKQLPRFSPEIQSGLERLFSQGMSNMDPNAMENLARMNFQTKTIPSIMERFTSFMPGAASAQRSSAMQSALGEAGSNLDAQLAALRSQMGLQQTQLGLTPSFESMYMPSTPGALQQGLPTLLALLGHSLMGA